MYFPIEDFCDISGFPYSEIFDNTKNAWEAIPKIEDLIEQLFKTGKVKANYKDSRNIYVGNGTTIMEDAVILGPAIIGKNCFISNAVLLRNNCLIGNNVNIGHACEIKNSIFLNGASAAHFNYVGDSIIGNNVNLSGGAMLANYRLDKNPVTIKSNGKKIKTGLLKFGSVIGDNSNIGVNAVLNPGTILGKNVVVFPLASVLGAHSSGKIIK